MGSLAAADLSLAHAVTAVALAIALAGCAGLRALLPIFATGLGVRAGLLDMGKQFAFLASDWALLTFGLASLVEMIGDKIPVVDHALDTVHTLLRPLSGSLLAAAALSSVSEPATAAALGIILGAPTALVPHATRSAVRVTSTATTAGMANPLLSFIEDLLSFGLLALTVLAPLLAAVGMIALAVFVLKRVFRRRPKPAAQP